MRFTNKNQVTDYLNHDEIECLVCRRRFGFLPAHIKRVHGLSAAEYRERYNLPAGAPLAGLAYRAKQRQKIAGQIESGVMTYDHLPEAVEAARESGRGQRTDYDRREQAQRAKNITRSPLPPGAKRPDGRDVEKAREYQRAYRAMKKGDDALMAQYLARYGQQ